MIEHKKGYTAGAFDVFHIGHLNLLKKAKQHCDYLIVGVTTNELIQETKNKQPLSNLKERIEILRAIKYVDKVVVQDSLDKIEAWKKHRYDILFSGDDWRTSQRWKEYETELNNLGAKVVYFPYTKSISSSALQKFVLEDNNTNGK